MNTAATEKQLAFARKLLARKPDWDGYLNGNLFERAFDIECDPSKFVGRTECSQLIDALLAIR